MRRRKEIKYKSIREIIKATVVAKQPVRCKLQVEDKTDRQVMSHKCLGMIVTSTRVIALKVRDPVTKGHGCRLLARCYIETEFNN